MGIGKSPPLANGPFGLREADTLAGEVESAELADHGPLGTVRKNSVGMTDELVRTSQ